MTQNEREAQRAQQDNMLTDLSRLRKEILIAERDARYVLDVGWYQAHPEGYGSLEQLRDALSDLQSTLDNLLVEVTAAVEKYPNV